LIALFFDSLQAVTKMIQEAFTYVEQTPDLETKLKLIDTLRTVTAGKVKLALILFSLLKKDLKAVYNPKKRYLTYPQEVLRQNYVREPAVYFSDKLRLEHKDPP